MTGQKETTKQIEEIVTACGQFLTTTDIDNASGVFSNPYRDGDTSASSEMLDLLKTGTTNDRRLLAQVSADRRLRVYEEPANTTVSYILKLDGTLVTKTGAALEPHLCPVGKWVQVEAVLGFQLGLIADPSLFFIETAEYSASTGKVSFTPRGVASAWDMLAKLQGPA